MPDTWSYGSRRFVWSSDIVVRVHVLYAACTICMVARDVWQRLPLSTVSNLPKALNDIEVGYMGLRTCTYMHVHVCMYDPSRNLLNVECEIHCKVN